MRRRTPGSSRTGEHDSWRLADTVTNVPRTRMLRTVLATTLVLIALVVPANSNADHSSAGYWHWGHNYVGASVNQHVYSGWNYWYDRWIHKHSGLYVYIGLDGPDANDVCVHSVGGYPITVYLTKYDFGQPCPGYNIAFVQHESGESSYLETDSVATSP